MIPSENSWETPSKSPLRGMCALNGLSKTLLLYYTGFFSFFVVSFSFFFPLFLCHFFFFFFFSLYGFLPSLTSFYHLNIIFIIIMIIIIIIYYILFNAALLSIVSLFEKQLVIKRTPLVIQSPLLLFLISSPNFMISF